METLIPPAMQAILAAPPLVPGEDEADYHRMVAQLGAESGAATGFDWVQVKDIADLTWQIARTRRWVSASVHRQGAAQHRRRGTCGVRSVVVPGSISEATHDHICGALLRRIRPSTPSFWELFGGARDFAADRTASGTRTRTRSSDTLSPSRRMPRSC